MPRPSDGPEEQHARYPAIQEPPMPRCLAVAVALLTALALAACGASTEAPTLSKDEIATQAKAALEKVVGQTAPPIDCPEDIPAEVGGTTTCTMHADEGDYAVSVTITSVDGEDVKFDVQVADTPTTT